MEIELKSDRFGMEIEINRVVMDIRPRVKIRPFRYGNAKCVYLNTSKQVQLKSDRFGMEI